MDPEPVEETKEEEQVPESVKEVVINEKPSTPTHKCCTYKMRKGPRNGKECGTPVFNDKNDTCFRHTPKADKPPKQQPQQPSAPSKLLSNPIQQSSAVRRAGTRDDLAKKLNAIANAAVNEIVSEKADEKGEKNAKSQAQAAPPRPPPMALAPPKPIPGSYKNLPTSQTIETASATEEPPSFPGVSGMPFMPPKPRYRRSPINKHKVGELIFDKLYCGAIRKVENTTYEKDWIDCRGAAAKIAADQDVKLAWHDLVELYFPDLLPEEVHPGIALVMASVGCIVAASTENKIEKVFQVPGYSKKRKRYEDESSDEEEIRRPRPRKRHKSLSVSQSSSDEDE